MGITQIFTLTDFFNQNAEGLSIDQVTENPKQANPDANPFNEYQKTQRITDGLTGAIKVSDLHDVRFNIYDRWRKYKETSNKAADYRTYNTSGGSIQYNIHVGNNRIKSHTFIGSNLQWQIIDEYKLKSLSDPNRKESTSEKNIEDTLILANQTITQSSIGLFISEKLEVGEKLSFTGSFRYDGMYNELLDKMNVNKPTDLSGSKDFNKTTSKIGAVYSFARVFNLFANWGLGFIPPATEELASNPNSFGGFNPNLVPATSNFLEIGFRGFYKDIISYDITGFNMATDKDFFRFKLYPARGNQEVFYGNTGSTKRTGLEFAFTFKPISSFTFRTAYTYSNFKYHSPDSLKNIRLPNSPIHQLSVDVEYKFFKHFTVGASADMQSDWTIYTDVRHKDLMQKGFQLFGARAAYEWRLFGKNGELNIYIKNIAAQKYMAFTEPDPDGNCYQPGTLREFFCSLKINF